MLRWGALPPRHADQYDWISVYLHDRDQQGIWRTLIFTATLALASSTALMIKSPQGPDGPVAVTICVVAAALALAAAVPFLLHWPTRRQSLAFSFTSTATIAAAALSYSNDYVGLMGCATFAVIGGFVAYFHTAHEVVANGAIAAICVVILAARLVSSTGDIYLTAAAVAIVATLNVGLPFGVLSLAQTLRVDLRSSGRDPLTGLHNRRSFHQSAYELIMRNDTEASRLMVIVIDLDSFKNLNDTAGHAAGDAALIRISAALADNCGHSAIIGRSGGEEFVIADVDHPDPPEVVAERLRRAIAELPVPVTASIGTACAPLKNGSQFNLGLLDELVEAADAAMYAAKRAGGDQVSHAADMPGDGEHQHLPRRGRTQSNTKASNPD
ncbi:diguanylate cyclase [Mycolicibacterium aromaticivorans JS19b1 = JCM 16368]|uniref:Diguanylate cyclase n=1 Tax=Mycolicibacterium aromaticivorans JS19b1 = JCM 16368 TaxID=1440774 RepID=A0A064CHV2_9MYCO|nr:GGDEF domain-containing protein [Mycolicibacterium aromaticivorans]KDE99915.1 diguanylate cyclase [Mycolicibacterium aromaticivorans JS19b1 = JCM 16368]